MSTRHVLQGMYPLYLLKAVTMCSIDPSLQRSVINTSTSRQTQSCSHAGHGCMILDVATQFCGSLQLFYVLVQLTLPHSSLQMLYSLLKMAQCKINTSLLFTQAAENPPPQVLPLSFVEEVVDDLAQGVVKPSPSNPCYQCSSLTHTNLLTAQVKLFHCS